MNETQEPIVNADFEFAAPPTTQQRGRGGDRSGRGRDADRGRGRGSGRAIRILQQQQQFQFPHPLTRGGPRGRTRGRGVQQQEQQVNSIQPHITAAFRGAPRPLAPTSTSNFSLPTASLPLPPPLTTSSTTTTTTTTPPSREGIRNEMKKQSRQERFRDHPLKAQLQALDEDYRIRRAEESKQSQRTLKGTCEDMCPYRLRLERIVNSNIGFTMFETDPQTGEPKHELMVKGYQKNTSNSDGLNLTTTDEIRTLDTLLRTMNYLIDKILMHPTADLIDIYNYLRDRFRSIAQDIHLQNLKNESTIDILEKISRFLAISQNLLASPTFEDKLNIEQLTKTLTTLNHLYSELRSSGASFPNEAEFLAYRLLIDPKPAFVIREQAHKLPDEVLNSPVYQFSLKVVGAISRGDFILFFKLLKAAPYRFACLMSYHFVDMWRKAFSCWNDIFKSHQNDGEFPISYLEDILAFEDAEHVKYVLGKCGIAFDNDKKTTKFGFPFEVSAASFSDDDDSEKIYPRKNERIVEAKRNGRTLKELIIIGDSEIEFQNSFSGVPTQQQQQQQRIAPSVSTSIQSNQFALPFPVEQQKLPKTTFPNIFGNRSTITQQQQQQQQQLPTFTLPQQTEVSTTRNIVGSNSTNANTITPNEQQKQPPTNPITLSIPSIFGNRIFPSNSSLQADFTMPRETQTQMQTFRNSSSSSANANTLPANPITAITNIPSVFGNLPLIAVTNADIQPNQAGFTPPIPIILPPTPSNHQEKQTKSKESQQPQSSAERNEGNEQTKEETLQQRIVPSILQTSATTTTTTNTISPKSIPSLPLFSTPEQQQQHSTIAQPIITPLHKQEEEEKKKSEESHFTIQQLPNSEIPITVQETSKAVEEEEEELKEETSKKINEHAYDLDWVDQEGENSIDIGSFAAGILKQTNRGHPKFAAAYWKIVLFLPSKGRQFYPWGKHILQKLTSNPCFDPRCENIQIISLKEEIVKISRQKPLAPPFQIPFRGCICRFTDFELGSMRAQHEMFAAQSIIFVVPDNHENDESWKTNLTSVFETASSLAVPNVPFYVIVPETLNEGEQDFIKNKAAEYQFPILVDIISDRSDLQNALVWLCERVPPQPNIRVEGFGWIFDENMRHHLLPSKDNCNDPEIIRASEFYATDFYIYRFNELVALTAQEFIDKKLLKLKWPPLQFGKSDSNPTTPEFGFNWSEDLKLLCKDVLLLQFPPFELHAIHNRGSVSFIDPKTGKRIIAYTRHLKFIYQNLREYVYLFESSIQPMDFQMLLLKIGNRVQASEIDKETGQVRSIPWLSIFSEIAHERIGRLFSRQVSYLQLGNEYYHESMLRATKELLPKLSPSLPVVSKRGRELEEVEQQEQPPNKWSSVDEEERAETVKLALRGGYPIPNVSVLRPNKRIECHASSPSLPPTPPSSNQQAPIKYRHPAERFCRSNPNPSLMEKGEAIHPFSEMLLLYKPPKKRTPPSKPKEPLIPERPLSETDPELAEVVRNLDDYAQELLNRWRAEDDAVFGPDDNPL